MPGGLDTAFFEMVEQVEFHWPERLVGERAQVASVAIGAIIVALVGLAVLARRVILLLTRDRSI
jgi:hypothetical protein